ncbi:hypothetical protein GCM10011360_35140 [Primorskyibacter flagellatus]|uniref:Uncharacterized protein n=1 Tax=Primorskyibacter flagellatus TaxID=1387277 RepID=A0A917ADH6_9RHOB|nr:hypothetical protein [Primorskyibacter flagellatus]GGE44840.1 hypothetical protein GCM10011360_35140 [Primorskyibacter flagellatus]
MNDEMWTFARFEPGQSFGTVTIPLDAERVAGWAAIYGAPQGDAAPDGLIVAGMMEAYIRAIQPRPKGNVHAAQKLAFSGAACRIGEEVVYHVSVLSAEEKRGRNWVGFGIRAEAGGRDLLRGEILSIWAA